LSASIPSTDHAGSTHPVDELSPRGGSVEAPNDAPDTNYGHVLRLGSAIALLGLAGFLGWAGLAPLDEGVAATGVIAVESSRKRVDHFAGGIVEKILVRDGQRVAAGDELLVLDKTQGRAQLNSTRAQHYTALANLARLRSEREGARQVTFPPELREAGSDPEVAALMQAQQDLFRSRRSALEGELRIARESARGLEAQIATLAQLKSGRETQIALLEEQLKSLRNLRSEGFVSRNSLLEVERQLAEVQGKQSEDLANIAGINARLAEFRMRASQREIEYRREVEAQAVEFQRELATLGERLHAHQDAFDRLIVRSPVAGRVVDLATHTVGGVVKPGDRVMDIVPEQDALVVEARIPTQYVDRVTPGLRAEVRLDAYASRLRRPSVEGRVEVVSADALVEERTGRSHYALRVSVPADEVRALDGLNLQPGMPVTVLVRTGERTMLAYLGRPLMRRFDGAFGEP
jgi:protease secretion system membrane fusion protein